MSYFTTALLIKVELSLHTSFRSWLYWGGLIFGLVAGWLAGVSFFQVQNQLNVLINNHQVTVGSFFKSADGSYHI
jgi:uncharacterized membrane protein (DUF441 family)